MNQDQIIKESGPRHVFISYKREDSAIARSLRQALRAEMVTVWWDEELRAGDHWPELIDTVLSGVDAVVVLWSAASVKSDWVRHEASIGKIQGKLAHARIDGAQIPAPFKSIHVEDLSGWNGREDAPSFQRLLQAVRLIQQRRAQAKRLRHLRFWAVTILLSLLSVGLGWILHANMGKTGRPTLIVEPPISLPDGRDPRQVLRDLHKVRPLAEEEHDLPLSALPNGVFGFDIPWADPSSDRSLGRSPIGTSVLEVHKLPNGSVTLVGFMSKKDASKLRNAESPTEVQLFPSPWEGAVRLVSIPTHRIVGYEHRSDFRNVIDLKLVELPSVGSMDSRSTRDELSLEPSPPSSPESGKAAMQATSTLEPSLDKDARTLSPTQRLAGPVHGGLAPLKVDAVPVFIDFGQANSERTGGCSCGKRVIKFPGELNGKAGEPLTFRYDGSEVCHGQTFQKFQGVIKWAEGIETPMANRNNQEFPGIAGTVRVTFSRPGVYNVVALFDLECVDFNCSQPCNARGDTTLVIQ